MIESIYSLNHVVTRKLQGINILDYIIIYMQMYTEKCNSQTISFHYVNINMNNIMLIRKTSLQITDIHYIVRIHLHIFSKNNTHINFSIHIKYN